MVSVFSFCGAEDVAFTGISILFPLTIEDGII
jgi:hypothetical protein